MSAPTVRPLATAVRASLEDRADTLPPSVRQREERADRELSMVQSLAPQKRQAAPPAEACAPQPLPDPLPGVQAFEAAMLPDSLRGWCVDAA